MSVALKVAVLTVSDTRTQQTDTSGAFLEEALRDAARIHGGEITMSIPEVDDMNL